MFPLARIWIKCPHNPSKTLSLKYYNTLVMSQKFKFHNPYGLYYITFAVQGWVNDFTRNKYKDILVDNLA